MEQREIYRFFCLLFRIKNSSIPFTMLQKQKPHGTESFGLTAAQLLNKFPCFVELEVSLLCLPHPATTAALRSSSSIIQDSRGKYRVQICKYLFIKCALLTIRGTLH